MGTAAAPCPGTCRCSFQPDGVWWAFLPRKATLEPHTASILALRTTQACGNPIGSLFTLMWTAKVSGSCDRFLSHKEVETCDPGKALHPPTHTHPNTHIHAEAGQSRTASRSWL